jgi:3-oxoacyl-[acyl-carrier protein] reductase
MHYAREGAKLAYAAHDAESIVSIQNAGKCRSRGLDRRVAGRTGGRPVGNAHKNSAIDVLLSNAGVMTRSAPLTELDVKKWDYTIAVNLRAPFWSQAVLPIMIKQKAGSIINVSSTIGRGAYANFLAYATSKWGLEGFTQTLAAEVRASHIRVNSVAPGYVATKLTGYSGTKPESVTDVFVYLASDESKGVTSKQLNSSGWKSELK